MPPSVDDYRQRIANVAIGPTTLRNQGAPGIVDVARSFLKDLDLARFVTDDPAAFLRELDANTEALRQSFPAEARENWGAARKSVNLFLAEAYYHQFVCKAYGLHRVVAFLEVPLDSQVAVFLREAARDMQVTDLPRWRGIKYVAPSVNKKYQDFALKFAKGIGADWERVHLDVMIWGR
ncbi:MAG: hypothetical protein HY316_08815 [Acidobacteria bacterium]|nr:hypothetical protein [Acidobacteriota bacterium]